MRAFLILYSILGSVNGNYAASARDMSRTDLCNPISLLFSNSYKPPNLFTHAVSFDFSFSVLNFSGGEMSYWDPARKNFSLEHELFLQQQGTLSTIQRRINAEETNIDYMCNLGLRSPCTFFLETDGIVIAKGNASWKSYEMPDGKHLNITPFQHSLLYLQKHAIQLQTQWQDTCKRLVGADTSTNLNYTFEYYTKSKQIFCEFNATLPITYMVKLICYGCVPITAWPKMEPNLITYIARNVTPSGPTLGTMCTITSPTGWTVSLSEYKQISKTTPSPTTVFRVTFIDTTFDEANQALDFDDPHANLRSGLIGSAVVLLVLLAAVLVAFRRLLGIVWLDTCVEQVRTTLRSLPGYLPPRSTNVSTVED
uniref:Membrane protein a155 n=1 Tax=Mastomys natalensis cytomegalovirus 2 TaxID=2973540 RepID=A0A9Y1ILJ5_9BETA|nr:membrane protein a155 [Mastomys natalensis cytomegalovirus 2]WEG69281.1 membrane protein a155 [Mastomys natalensis cytomegalovirus 2]WEG69420.1 membrane protein a155 [Mastomys natalensis cytomegalovirus 2]WEG69558.1 membrane protein a155 [Mastomys natalensis cytomegalovirus 2]WEG69696.1 membrane protein a155 [Mastomys natalensis cytomegalovirus 2]